MRASLKWLKDYVDFNMTGAELSGRLTETLTETVRMDGPGAGVSGVVVAKIVTVEPHPNADALSVCVVDWGRGSSSVVCGAPNARPGLVGVLALPGARLAGGRLLREQTIRGLLSRGMLVSEAELGMSEDAAGLIELGDDVVPGGDAVALLGLGDDVLELDVQPNRPDCLGMIGIAREVAALDGGALRLPRFELREAGTPAAELARVEIEDAAGCPRYIARVVRGVSVGPSPTWLATRLRNAGLRSINNVVDVTNFVMLEWGHPVHAFDWGRLREKRIVVRRARAGEVLTTLDGIERKLDLSHLLICDGPRPVALAGVMGGAATEVSAATTDILIECAWFDPVTIRKGARSLGLRTDATQRFERGIDPEAMDRVVDRAACLMAELAGGTVAPGRVDAGERPPNARSVVLRTDRLRRMIAPELSAEKAAACLARLGFVATVAGGACDALEVRVPSHRRDIEIEADLIEEVARIYGYDKVATFVPFHSVTASAERGIAAEAAVRDAMAGLGFLEILTTSFASPRALESMGELGRPDEAVVLTNPVNREMPLLRTTLLPAVLSVVARNTNVGERSLRLFEIGRVFSKRGGELVECVRLAGAMCGDAVRATWDGKPRPVDVFDVKGALSALWEALEVDSPSASCYDGRALDRGAAMTLSVDGRDVGVLGALSRDVVERWDFADPVFVFELEIEWVASRLAAAGVFKGLPRYPKVRRDAAFVVREEVPAGDLVREVAELREPLLLDVRVFDLFRGKQLAPGKKSLGLSFTYQSSERTLTDREVDEAHGRVVRRLLGRFEAKLRD
jgi:phenylalanyl-tRNA synthetase beta chain